MSYGKADRYVASESTTIWPKWSRQAPRTRPSGPRIAQIGGAWLWWAVVSITRIRKSPSPDCESTFQNVSFNTSENQRSTRLCRLPR